jgi:hypothetical protein
VDKEAAKLAEEYTLDRMSAYSLHMDPAKEQVIEPHVAVYSEGRREPHNWTRIDFCGAEINLHFGPNTQAALNLQEKMARQWLARVAAARTHLQAKAAGLKVIQAGRPKPGSSEAVVEIHSEFKPYQLVLQPEERLAVLGGHWCEVYGLPGAVEGTHVVRMVAVDGVVVWEGPKPKCLVDGCPHPAVSYHQGAACEEHGPVQGEAPGTCAYGAEKEG